MRIQMVLVSLMLSVGCPADSRLYVEDYDTSCVQDEDCVLVTGYVCGVCPCPDRALSNKSLEKYTQDYEDARRWCPPQGDVVCGPCLPLRAICEEGTCKAGPPLQEPMVDMSSSRLD